MLWAGEQIIILRFVSHFILFLLHFWSPPATTVILKQLVFISEYIVHSGFIGAFTYHSVSYLVFSVQKKKQ